MITEAARVVGQIRPHVEDEGCGDEAQGPERSEEKTERSSKGPAGCKRGRKNYADGAEAHEAQTNEGVVNPKEVPNERRQVGQMRAHPDDAGHHCARAEQTEMEDAGDFNGES